jgi:hypothetical protein
MVAKVDELIYTESLGQRSNQISDLAVHRRLPQLVPAFDDGGSHQRQPATNFFLQGPLKALTTKKINSPETFRHDASIPCWWPSTDLLNDVKFDILRWCILRS